MAGSKKNARRRKDWIVFQDESGLSERPSVRRTWAPRGATPVLIHAFNWKKLSVCAALAYRWDGKRSRLYFRLVGEICGSPIRSNGGRKLGSLAIVLLAGAGLLVRSWWYVNSD